MPSQSVAREAIVGGLLPQLKPADRISIVLFDTAAYVLQPMAAVSEINVGELKAKVSDVRTKVTPFFFSFFLCNY